MATLLKNKQQSQPLYYKTCGSVFKNPQGKKAWELIDQAGFRGYKVGDAQISEKHCNFIINHGCKDSSDIEKLCHKVKECVYKKSGIKMELELVIL